MKSFRRWQNVPKVWTRFTRGSSLSLPWRFSEFLLLILRIKSRTHISKSIKMTRYSWFKYTFIIREKTWQKKIRACFRAWLRGRVDPLVTWLWLAKLSRLRGVLDPLLPRLWPSANPAESDWKQFKCLFFYYPQPFSLSSRLNIPRTNVRTLILCWFMPFSVAKLEVLPVLPSRTKIFQ